ncbi:MAG: hypothetical protein IME93_07170 [Proteobacteria bacterium]|nr:hypothetical protein [Pseudomonadota bacterium]
MKKLNPQLILVMIIFAASCYTTNAYAVGTPARTSISNTASLSYTVGVASLNASDTVVLIVQEYIDVTSTWQDAANINVATPDTDQPLTFQVVNTGNGTEKFLLSVFNADVTDQFDPTNARIYFDNGNGSWDGIASEILYQPGVNDPILNANGVDRVLVYAVNDIPGSLAIGNLGNSRLDAQSATLGAAGSTAGTVLIGLGDSGVNAIVGGSQAQANTTGTYEVGSAASVTVTLNKTSSVISNLEGCSVAPCDPNPGATIRYTIQVVVSGIGIAESLVITDPVPANTSYSGNSITLDGTGKTDGIDADEADITAGIITVNLGDVTSPTTHTITFDAIIN